MDTKNIKIWLPFMMAIVLAGGMFLGFRLEQHNAQKIRLFGPARNTKFDEIMNYIEANYVDDVKKDDLYDGAINAMLANLDPHSVYIPAKEIAGVEEEMVGNFEGIGIEFFIVNDTIMVVTPISGGPSELLGMQAGDRIIKINDSLVAGIKIQNSDVVKKLKGPGGTKVKVSIKRNGSPNLIDYTITRDKIPLYSLDAGFMVKDGIGYIKINRFSATTYEEFMKKLMELQAKGMTKLILDLRENPGGFLEQATAILDEILDGRKQMVYTQGRSFPKMEYNAKVPGRFEDGKIAILMDEGSASASEIVAGAIQDWDRGIIVGRRSFGKGLVQDQYQLPDGSALRLTIAKYFTPSGRCIQKSYKEGLDDYNQDVVDRYKHGEIFNKDSIHNDETMVFYTKIKHRKVFGGGGITPDFFVPLDTSTFNPLLGEIISKGLIQQFAYNYYSSNKEKFANYKDIKDYNSNFKIDETMYGTFINYAYQSGVSKSLEKYKIISQSELSKRLKAFFAKQKWQNDGFYPLILEDDKTFRKALLEIEKL
jgi:carboxyl-terminal processing protease